VSGRSLKAQREDNIKRTVCGKDSLVINVANDIVA